MLKKQFYSAHMQREGWEEITNINLSDKLSEVPYGAMVRVKLFCDKWQRLWCLIIAVGY